MQTADEMRALIARLYRICRSITGNGLRETLAILQEKIPLEIREVATGSKVFDWTIPQEWNIRDAYIKDLNGNRLVDFQQSNLHIVSYSTPIDQRIAFSELRDHLFTSPDHPDWIPYRTSYYNETWGFCLSENQLAQFDPAADYDVCIDSSLSDGSLTYGEYFIPGETTEEILLSCHICHPSLADDNLSGIAMSVAIADHLAASRTPRRYSYRFVFVPGSIGAITWLARNEDRIAQIRHGLVLTCVGDAAPLTYKRSRQANAEVDRAFTHILQHSGEPHQIVPFTPYGYDERQYCSPGVNLAVGCMMRSVHGTFPEYHTSADNLDFIRPASLADSFTKCLQVFDLLEANLTYRNNSPKGEPQLGKRGLYQGLGAGAAKRQHELALLWVLNLSDGSQSLLDIAEEAALPFATIKGAADALAATDLLSLVTR